MYRYGEQYKVVWFKFGVPDGVSQISTNDNDSKLKSNIYRAKSRITEIALCNDFQYFVTLTIDSEKQSREDLQKYVHDLGVWIGNYNRKYGCKLQYILIPERHKDGKSWHMHGLFGGVSSDSLRLNQYGYLDMPYYARRFGFISLSAVKDKARVSRYITKYVTKSCSARIDDIGQHLFYASHGLKSKELITEVCCEPCEGAFDSDYTMSIWVDSDDKLAQILCSARSVDILGNVE